jgi:hypothetical protein
MNRSTPHRLHQRYHAISSWLPGLVNVYIAIENGPVEIVDLPMKKMVLVHRFLYVYQLVLMMLAAKRSPTDPTTPTLRWPRLDIGLVFLSIFIGIIGHYEVLGRAAGDGKFPSFTVNST